MSEAPLHDRLLRVIAAWTGGDAEGALSLMSDDIVWHYACPGLPPLRGKAAARRLLSRFMGEMREIDWRIVHHAETADRLFVEGVDAYRTPEGAQVAVPYAGVLDFKDGLITGWRDYVDLQVVADQKAGKPAAAHVEALVAPAAAAA